MFVWKMTTKPACIWKDCAFNLTNLQSIYLPVQFYADGIQALDNKIFYSEIPLGKSLSQEHRPNMNSPLLKF